MEEKEKINLRRKVLIGMTAAVGAVGVSFAAVPFHLGIQALRLKQ